MASRRLHARRDRGGSSAATKVGETPLLELERLTRLVARRLRRRARARGSSSRTRRRIPPGASRRAAPRSPSTRRERLGLRGRDRRHLRQLRRRRRLAGGHARARLHHRPGGLRLAPGAGSRRSSRRDARARRYGAEVWQLTVGPELFYTMLRTARGDRLLQRVALHAVRRRRNRDARRRDRARRRRALTGARRTPSSSPTPAAATSRAPPAG